MKYFSYGSNMSEKRMIGRGLTPIKKELAVLYGHKFTINKKSQKHKNIGFANIIPSLSSHVEGILYTLESDNDIKILDRCEGYPKHYDRKIILVEVAGKFEEAIVYIATNEWSVNKEIKTTLEYKNHILGGDELLSKKYVDWLKNFIKI